MSDIYSEIITVKTTDTDLYDNLRPAALLQYFQDMGTAHAGSLNMSRDYLVEKYHASWILVRVWLKLTRPIHSGDEIRIDTWHRGASGMIFYRDFDIYLGEEHVGEGVSSWVVADIENRKMLRPAMIDTIAEARVSQRAKERQLKLIKEPKGKEKVYERMVRYADLDINGHMNNTKYADVIMDAFTPEELAGRYPGELQLNYSQECLYGEIVDVSRKYDGETWYVDGCCGDGKRRFEATLRLV